MIRLFKRKSAAAATPLTPGLCECGHMRCVHKDSDDGDSVGDEPTPSPSELERLYSK